jgi:nitroreductase
MVNFHGKKYALICAPACFCRAIQPVKEKRERMFNELAEKRRSIKVYAGRPVESEKIDAIIEAALRSPSGGARRLLGLPETLTIQCIIAIGYPGEEMVPYKKDELRFDKVSYNRYGQKKA